MHDFVIVGAGLSGCVLAEHLANAGNKVLLLEKRSHIAGNAYDYYDDNGVLVHKYGPHIFHTSNEDVWAYLSQFTEWHKYHHEVNASVDGKLIPLRFNLNSIEIVFPDKSQLIREKLINAYGMESTVSVMELMNNPDLDLKALGDFLYDKIFVNYTLKQWGMKLDELDPAVAARVPIAITYKDGYFNHKYQALPLSGYTSLCENMLKNPNIDLRLNTDFFSLFSFSCEGKIFQGDAEFLGKLIYTGEIDHFFNYKYGELPYRSLEFIFENHSIDSYQGVAVVNYPNEFDFTRITEFKKMTGQNVESTTIIKEYPKVFKRGCELIPYYPIPKDEFKGLYRMYEVESKKLDRSFFIGRLAEYKYYDMDQIVANAMNLANELIT